jgi:hypothetical protein
MEKQEFNLWAFGDAHVCSDLRHNYQSLAEALSASEFGGNLGGPAFDWDIGVDVGDMSSEQGLPTDKEGKEVIRQFQVLKKHSRESVYNVCGNHDRSGLHEPQGKWWQKWVDPLGKHTQYSQVHSEKRPYKIHGTWERYSFRIGNILFLMMSDINEPTQKIGRGDLGGNPGGVVSGETFRWWKQMVETNRDSIIISVHHYMLKNTTVASGEWEGLKKDAQGNWQNHYHGYKPQGTPKGASYLYFVDSKPDAQAFETYLEKHPGAVSIWLGGHTHTHPDDAYGNKSHIEQKWGTYFINVASLSRYHGYTNVPKSRLLTFRNNNSRVRVRCYMHTDEFLPQGWYDKAERILHLDKMFKINNS